MYFFDDNFSPAFHTVRFIFLWNHLVWVWILVSYLLCWFQEALCCWGGREIRGEWVCSFCTDRKRSHDLTAGPSLLFKNKTITGLYKSPRRWQCGMFRNFGTTFSIIYYNPSYENIKVDACKDQTLKQLSLVLVCSFCSTSSKEIRKCGFSLTSVLVTFNQI